MRIAFHTPLKPVDHPVPSGDRAMARELVALLDELGNAVWLAARHRSGVPVLPPAATHLDQQRRGRAQAAEIVRRWHALPRRDAARFDLWLSYHVYYKKPDWIGPHVASALGIPYVVVEASHAPKRRYGPWRVGHRAVESALRRADLVLTLNPNDAACVRPLLAAPRLQRLLPPFLDIAPYQAAWVRRRLLRDQLCAELQLDAAAPLLLSVAMMRAGDKLASYRVLAAALAQIVQQPWQLVLVGDGEARTEVEAIFAPFGSRVRFAGVRPPAALPAIYAAADLYLWPAINEAYGMTLLEAQAAGLAVVAGRTGGVPAVVRDGVGGMLVPIGDATAFAAAVRHLLGAPVEAARLRDGARAYVTARHGHAAVGRRLQPLLRSVMCKPRPPDGLP